MFDLSGALQAANLRFLMDGLFVTLQISFFTIIFSIILGIILGSLRYWRIPFLSQILAVIIDLIRNLPLLLIIFFAYFALPQIGWSLNVFWSTVVAMTIFEAAMISEIIRGGLEALAKSQTEAGLASGLTKRQVMFDILLPQALHNTLPSMVSQLIALIKDTSLATIINLPELTHNAKIIYGQDTGYVLPMFAVLALCYFTINFALTQFSRYLARKSGVKTMVDGQGTPIKPQAA
ncbi:amino acid ABC transporter permease [Hutsoniella sourekii]